MGCSSSSTENKKSEKVVKAALVIQNWYRGYRARLKARQHYALTIFQSIEYADEQGQMQLSNFFTFMLENFTPSRKEDPALVSRLFETTFQDIKDRRDYVGLIDVPDSYEGPRLEFPLTFTDIGQLLEAFKQQQASGNRSFPGTKQILHAHYVLGVLFETRKLLKQMPNFTHVKTSPSKEITVCGDLHGKLDDLFLIFYKNGLPSGNNPYVFNGDFVDRGSNSIEVLMVLLMRSVLMPPVSINKDNATDLKKSKMGITLTAPGRVRSSDLSSEQLSKHEWEQIVDILWSDPRGRKGCYPNTSRGGGCYFGPDVTSKILNKYQLKMLIRSHECKHDGYEICHDGKVITIFSASNYYEEGSNRGAYIRLGCGMNPRFFQYRVTSSTCMSPLHHRVHAMENSAIRILKERIISRKTDLMHAFQLRDHSRSGMISMEEFRTMWKLFRTHYSVDIDDSQVDSLANTMDLNKDGSIDFNEFLKAFYVVHKYEKLSTSETKSPNYK
ncbi:Serine/threonine-protein phosphatase with EF-hands 1 [Sciurus carolinensis]|uniref:Serine/threonine-protein phosphatase with EF-hands 1 n=1 Tax=Sciurus carolinensis TaxID=30640 RepID=A0AA41N382_SCICA|nr:Serine/threonine-protein phosphatase with EF-hands 1 [Sciurus carolinensis]